MIYGNWEKFVGAVLRRENDRRIACFQSFSSSTSADFGSRFSFDPLVGDVRMPPDLCSQSKFFFCNVMGIEYEEIKKATKNFQPDFLLGQGAFGPVFKGWIDEHDFTAVKPGSGIAVADEINCLSRLHHPNFVELFGYCFNINNRILVYDFVPRGSMDSHLFTRGHESLPWATRIKVGVGAARALAFLHSLAIPLIYRGFKSADILLDGDFNTKLHEMVLPVTCLILQLALGPHMVMLLRSMSQQVNCPRNVMCTALELFC